MVISNHIVLKDLLEKNEEWLMESILGFAKKQGYSAYTSTLKEAWRLSISGLSASIIEGLQHYKDIPELNPEDDFSSDPVSQFGIIEAQKHRDRGISLNMFLGLMKYYRQSYINLIRLRCLDPSIRTYCEHFIHRIFDRVEIGFCIEWSGAGKDASILEMQNRNRIMTNEKNKYLTIFESIPNPIFILNRDGRLDNMNHAATRMFDKNLSSGSSYYSLNSNKPGETSPDFSLNTAEGTNNNVLKGSFLRELLPWLKDEIEKFNHEHLESIVFEKDIEWNGVPMIFRIRMAKNLDVSGKFDGTLIILEDVTPLKKALEEITTLSGFIPICAHCKNIRDDTGFWQKIEEYVSDRSEAAFSHSICPDCVEKYYAEYNLE